jgi:hypothetical protein
MRVQTAIEIDADRDAVWAVLMDFPAYAEWNDLLVRVETRAEPGAPVDLRVRMSGRTVALDARVVTADPGRQLRWIGPRSAAAATLLRGDHSFTIEDVAPARVRFVHVEEFTGALAPLVGWWLRRTLTPAHRAFNEGLRRRVETSRPRAR